MPKSWPTGWQNTKEVRIIAMLARSEFDAGDGTLYVILHKPSEGV